MELSLTPDHRDRSTRLAELEAEVRRLNAELAAERARAAPADGEAKFHAIADSIDQMIWSTTADGQHDYFNRRWYEYTGVPEGSTDGEAWSGMFHPDDQERTWAVWRHSLETGEPYQIEYRLRHRSGAYRWVLGRAQPVSGSGGGIVRWYGTCTDIHDLKQTEAALRTSEERLQRALDAGQIGDYEWDLRTGETRWSDNLMQIVGLPRVTRIDGEEVFELIHPDDRAAAKEAVERAIDGEGEIDTTYRVIGTDGVTRWIASRGRVVRDAEGAPLRLVGVNYDVTAAREAADRLRETEARLQTLTDNLPGVVVYQVVTSRDMSERSYVYVSGNALEVLGVPAERAVADPAALMERIDPDQLPAVLQAEREAAAAMETLDIQLRGRAPRSDLRVRIISRPRELPDGRLIWDGIVIDITERRRQQEEAERTAALLGAIGAATPDLIFAKDLNFRFLYANEATCRTIGIPPERAVGASNRDIAGNEEEGRAFDENDRRVIESGRSEVVEEIFTSPDGTRRVFRSAKAPMRDAKGVLIGLVGVATDITDRVQAEELLRQSEERLREESRTLGTLNRTGAALAAQLDIETLVKMVTDAGVELTGAQFGAFFHNVTNEAGERYMLFTLSGAERSQFDFGMPRATAIFHPTFAGEGVIRSDDITADQRYGLSGPHFGMPKGHLPVRSYLAVSVIGRSGEVIGGLFFGHEEPERFSERHEQLMTGIAAQAAIAMDNARLFQSAQRELLHRERAERALRALNETLEQRVIAEVERRGRAEEALRQAQKMETLGQLTGGVAHDFNNLLQIVSGNLEILQRGLPETEARMRRAAENAARGAERAAVLTQRLLAFSRRQPLAPKPVDANRLVTGMLELLHRSLGETITVETALAPDLWAVEADSHQLENAILNLAVNARDAMDGGGKLVIATSNEQLGEPGDAPGREAPAGDYVAIRVKDSGCGMDADTVARAFEPFFTTKEVGKGTGLGLSMVYGFVKQSGGDLQIDSEPGRGTDVALFLPRRLDGAPAGDAEPGEAAPERAQDEVILVCEDDHDVRAYTVEVLGELGYLVLEAQDGAAALAVLEDGEQRVDLLFTDVVLPGGMTGAELARAAQALRPGLKLLYTTGYARDAIVHQGRLDAGVELITKPFTYGALAARVREVLDASI